MAKDKGFTVHLTNGDNIHVQAKDAASAKTAVREYMNERKAQGDTHFEGVRVTKVEDQ